MRRLLFCCLVATSSLLGQESFLHNPHCPFLVGIDMPAGKYPTKQTLYFVHRFTKPPQCFIDDGEAQIVDANSEFVRIAGKPSSRVVIRCREAE